MKRGPHGRRRKRLIDRELLRAVERLRSLPSSLDPRRIFTLAGGFVFRSEADMLAVLRQIPNQKSDYCAYRAGR